MDYDCHQAKRLLQARRSRSVDDGLACFCSPFSSSRDFTYQEVNSALAQLIEADGPIGIIKSLLFLGADVDFERRPSRGSSFWGITTQREEPGLRSDLLLRATLRCRPETVRAIASLADQVTLDDAFRQAALRNDLPVLQALLDHGGQLRPSFDLLDAALGKASEVIGEKDTRAAQHIIQKCLAGGAYGPETERFMAEGAVKAIQYGKSHLLDTILQETKPTSEFLTHALIQAIRSQQLNILLRLLRFPQSTTTLAIAVSEAMRISDAPLRYELIRILIGFGAKESCTAEALVYVVKEIISDENLPSQGKDELRRLFRFLLDEGMADVDHNDAEALRLAVKASQLDVVEEIVSRQPSANSLGSALPLAMGIRDQRGRRDMLELLLRFQINEEAVSRALVDSIKDGKGNKTLIRLLLTRASVNYNNGEVFIYTVRQNKLDILHLLLDQGTSYKALFTAVREALNAPTPQRRVIFGVLLRHLQLDHLNEALKHIILEEETDLCLVSAFLEAGAAATYDNGVCIKHAAYRLDRSALRILSEHSGRHVAIFTQALDTCIGRGRLWISYEHVEVIQLLLLCGASRSLVVSQAMTELVDHLAGKKDDGDLASTLLEILFSAGADVNHDGGKAIEIATRRHDTAILAHLLRHKISALAIAEQAEMFYRNLDEKPSLGSPSLDQKEEGENSLLSNQDDESPMKDAHNTIKSEEAGYIQEPPRVLLGQHRKCSPKVEQVGVPYFTQANSVRRGCASDVNHKVSESGLKLETGWSLHSERMPVVSVTEVDAMSPINCGDKRNHTQVFFSQPISHHQHTPKQESPKRHHLLHGFRKAQQYGHAWRSDRAWSHLPHEKDHIIAEKEVEEILKGYGKSVSQPEMTEVKTRRGLVIGHVDLTELRRWQNMERV